MLFNSFYLVYSFLDSLCILCLKEIIWAMTTIFAILMAMGKIFGPLDFFHEPLPEKWPWLKNVAHGKKGKI